MDGFWVGTAFGALGIIVPSLVALAVIVSRAPFIEDDRLFDHIAMPRTMESSTAGL